jgi:pre-mRNA-processing factor 19
MLCCISGQVPEEPVVSRINGALYERRLIEKYLDANGTCPKTGAVMMKDDLIAVAGGAATGPRAVAATSIPALLSLLQGEWDGLMLEQFSLRQQLATTQQELSHALYKHDASCRVIARLMGERDAAVEAAGSAAAPGSDAQQQQQAQQAQAAGYDEDAEAAALPDDVCAEIDRSAARLKTARKRREVPRACLAPADVEQFVETASLTIAKGSARGFGCVDVQDVNGGRVVFAGGADGRAACFDVARGATASMMVGHTQAVKQIAAVDDVVVTCSDDGSTRVWREERCAATMGGHKGAVTGFAVLASKQHVITAGTDGALVFQDLVSGAAVATANAHETNTGINCVALHPDGFMAATGTGDIVHVWDVKAMQVDVELPQKASSGNVTCLAFCEDGFTMAVGTSRGVVHLWDLRNLGKPLEPLTFADNSDARPNAVNALSFDRSGQFLAIGAGNVKVWAPKTHTELAVLATHRMPVTGVAWGENARWLASSSSDKTVKVWAPKF